MTKADLVGDYPAAVDMSAADVRRARGPAGRRLIVLDDDPTGTQSVGDPAGESLADRRMTSVGHQGGVRSDVRVATRRVLRDEVYDVLLERASAGRAELVPVLRKPRHLLNPEVWEFAALRTPRPADH